MDRYLSLVGPPEIVNEIAEIPPSADARIGKPQSAVSLVDAADAPIGPDEVMAILAMITIGAKTAKALLDLLKSVRDLLKRKHAPGQSTPIQLVDTRTGKTLATITSDTSDEDLKGISDSG